MRGHRLAIKPSCCKKQDKHSNGFRIHLHSILFKLNNVLHSNYAPMNVYIVPRCITLTPFNTDMSMNLRFFKYQGAGNDFILLDCRESSASLTKDQIARMCDRNFGIGADGLMYLEPPRHEGDHFYMVYFNADGSESTCGNGGRCISKFATDLGIAAHRLHFHAIDGPHWAEVNGDSVALGMIDAPAVVESNGAFFVDTGSPHHVVLNDSHPDDFIAFARPLRNDYGEEDVISTLW